MNKISLVLRQIVLLLLNVLPAFLSLSEWCTNMKLLELGDSVSRFRFSQSCVGFAGCLCVIYAVWTPYWLKDRGLWAEWNNTNTEQTNHKGVFNGERQTALPLFDIFQHFTSHQSKAPG